MSFDLELIRGTCQKGQRSIGSFGRLRGGGEVLQTRYALKLVVSFRAKVEFGQVVIVRKDRLQLVYMFGGGA